MVVMGRVTAPYGVKGWFKVYALTAQPGNLCDYPVWWLRRDGDWREMRVVSAKVHANLLVAQLVGIEDREAAVALKGAEIAVPRAQLPVAGDEEYYWADLIGLKVVNAEHYEFGRLTRIMQTGANDVLVVESKHANERETLIPFIAGVIRQVDLAAGVISVDWGRDY
jgi:16S rRNA processing protein RimM